MTEPQQSPRRSSTPGGGSGVRTSDRDKESSPLNVRRDKEKDLALIGKEVAGKYRVLKVLGQGGFGSVFLVEMVSGIVGDKLAMKVLPREFSANKALRDQFLNEIRVAMKMVTKYIVQIRDVGVTEDDLLYYTMDYVPGRSLAQILREEGALAPPRALRIVMRVLKALSTAHAAGIIHRDLKPANIMIETNGSSGRDTTRVLDFGIATAIGGESEQQKGFSGSPNYMPPEQFLSTELGYYTDLYSVGVILYECLSGQKPYRGSSPKEVYSCLKSGPPTAIEELVPEVRSYPGLTDAVKRALERNPEKRFQSAREFYDRLNESLRASSLQGGAQEGGAPDEQPAAAQGPAPSKARVRTRRRRRRATRSSVAPALVTAAVLLAGAYVVFRLANEPGAGSAQDRVGASHVKNAPEGSPPVPVKPDPRRGKPAPKPETDGGAPAPDGDLFSEQELLRREEELEKALAKIPDYLEFGRKAAAEGNWNTAGKFADEVIHLRPQDREALLLRGKAFVNLGKFQDAITTLEDLRKMPGESSNVEACLLLADAYMRLPSPDLAAAAPILESAWDAAPRNAEVGWRLANLYGEQGRNSELLALLRKVHGSGIKHEKLDALYRELIVKAEARRREESTEFAAKARQAFDERRYKDAAEAAAHAAGLVPSACVQVLLIEAYVRSDDLSMADRAIERLAELAKAGGRFFDDAGTCDPPLSPESITHWVKLFQGRSAYLRHVAEGKRSLLNQAEAHLDQVLLQVKRKDEPLLYDLARTYRGCVLSRKSNDVSLVEKEFRPTIGNRSEEIVQRQADAYYHLGQKIPAESFGATRQRERQVKDLTDSIRRDKQKIQSTESAKARNALRKRVAEAAQKLEKLLAAKSHQQELKETALRAFDLAVKKMNIVLNRRDPPKDLQRSGYYFVGKSYLRQGVLSGEASIFKKASIRFKRAEDAGLESAELYEQWAETYVHREDHVRAGDYYRKAFDKEPSPARCLLAADHYTKGRQREKAERILEEAWKQFPSHAGIKGKLVEAKR